MRPSDRTGRRPSAARQVEFASLELCQLKNKQMTPLGSMLALARRQCCSSVFMNKEPCMTHAVLKTLSLAGFQLPAVVRLVLLV